MPRKKPTLAILAGLIICSLGSCASLQITTWIMRSGELIHGSDRKAVLEAEGYRCYSLADDTAWRELLKSNQACCNGGSGP